MIEKRVTVDFDEESYYLDGEFWESWDNFGEEMADAINEEFDKLRQENEQLKKENEELKFELQRIYDVATLKKARGIVDTIYDDLLYETSEESDYARNKVLECLEKLDEFGDELE